MKSKKKNLFLSSKKLKKKKIKTVINNKIIKEKSELIFDHYNL